MDTAIQKKLDNFFNKYKAQNYKKGEIFIRADEEPQGIFYLTKGSIKQYAISKKGEELVINVFKPISFFPMSWAINLTPNAYYFETIDEVEIRIVPKDEVIGFIKSNPDVIYDLLSRVYRGTDGLLQRMTYLMAGNAYSRLINELLIQTKRFGKKNLDGSFELKISEKDLAAASGMTRETISRKLRILKDKKIVTLQTKQITINDFKKLEQEFIE